ncbi:MAG: hypothetical protein LUO98_01635 [Methanoregula sp.]|nr:hypothetical protein [Methanoregula sp.]
MNILADFLVIKSAADHASRARKGQSRKDRKAPHFRFTKGNHESTEGVIERLSMQASLYGYDAALDVMTRSGIRT